MTRPRNYILISSVTFGLLLLATFFFLAPYFFTGTASAAVIRIPRDATAQNLKDSLRKYFDADYSSRAVRAFDLLGRTPAERYGAYEIPEGTSPAAAARILSRGAQTAIPLTINGVRKLDTFLPRIASKFNFTADDLSNLLNDSTLMASYGLTPQQAPALFLNDTYYLYWTASAKDLIDKLADNYNRFWTPANRDKATALGLSPAEISIVASITDEETNAESEKGRVGRLYINRLHQGMKLQADPTVRYALNDFTIKRITEKHLSAPGPYNTYRIHGLPPGPIRTVSTRTLQAILDSKPSDDLYMCAKEDFSGTHNFASTYDEHLRNARRYRRALDDRGIK
ncbi:MAG: endolytic transglycosylase MltG [Muribaculaceae bacterium]|nr:endolytic transglycosylase MltG [Muribaculaceae bacterium]